MKYKKINDATVQCIVSADDMSEYGLTLSDIFERNERGEEFLRDIIERAHEEVGYQINNGNIAMQITPLKDNGRMFVFASMHETMQYAATIPNTYSVKSHLYKEGGDYYLVLEKNRLSYKAFNRISAQAVEFGNLIAVSEERMQYLEEHGECLIRNRAVSRLRRIYLA